jgi:flagellar FliJ protein
MQPLAKMAQQNADDAARVLAECRSTLEAKQHQLDELVSYRDDYASGLRTKGLSGLNASRITDYNLFLGRLNKAIEQQQTVVANARSELDASKRHWLEKQQRSRALDSVVTRYRHQEQRQQSRREQREHDEHSHRSTSRDRR